MTYTVKCSNCKMRGTYEDGVNDEPYECAELAGWQWSESRGWACDRCNFKTASRRMTKPIAVQTALI